MTRTLEEWHGRTPDTPVPPRVRIRIFERDKGRCQCGCKVRIRPGMAWQTDHIIAIINGGENRESNLRTLLTAHHAPKTAADVAEKSAVYRIKLVHLGMKQSKNPLPGGKRSRQSKKVNGVVVPRQSGNQKHRAAMAAIGRIL